MQALNPKFLVWDVPWQRCLRAFCIVGTLMLSEVVFTGRIFQQEIQPLNPEFVLLTPHGSEPFQAFFISYVVVAS